MPSEWTAPTVERTAPARIAGERESLEQWLDFQPEYARHNGHADLVRERIDGTVGI
jgi:hypothetical protein